MRVTVLGCGGSSGVPLIGDHWGACDPREPRNRRRRVSILVEHGDTRVLVDTSPDLRAQLLDARTDRLSAVVYTHAHADHLHGIDDLRAVNYYMRSALPAYGRAETLEQIRRRFDYAFLPPPADGDFYRPCLLPRPIDATPDFEIADLAVRWFAQDHGSSGTSTGYRFGPRAADRGRDAAYSTDVVALSEEAFQALEGVGLWIVDCLRWAPHHSHANFDLAVSWAARIRPRRTLLTHMNHAMDYRQVLAKCPPGVEPAHDGMVVEL